MKKSELRNIIKEELENSINEESVKSNTYIFYIANKDTDYLGDKIPKGTVFYNQGSTSFSSKTNKHVDFKYFKNNSDFDKVIDKRWETHKKLEMSIKRWIWGLPAEIQKNPNKAAEMVDNQISVMNRLMKTFS